MTDEMQPQPHQPRQRIVRAEAHTETVEKHESKHKSKRSAKKTWGFTSRFRALRSWFTTSLASGFGAAGLTAIAMQLPTLEAGISFSVGVVTFLIVLLRNPEYYYRRLLSAVVGVWSVSSILPTFGALIVEKSGTLAHIFSSGPTWPFHLTAASITLGLLITELVRSHRTALTPKQAKRDIVCGAMISFSLLGMMFQSSCNFESRNQSLKGEQVQQIQTYLAFR